MAPQTEIVSIVEEMQAHAGTPEERRALFGAKYPEFAERYPGLFFKSSEGGMDMKMLKFMLENVGDAAGEEKVGQELFERYVSPAFADRFKGKF
jgi:hypothetical protein